MKTQKERMHTGELYRSDDKDILTEQLKCLEKLYDFNQTRPSEQTKRDEMLKDMLAECGENCYIEPPFHANWGGKHLHFGNVGDNTMIGPNVTLASAGHPVLPKLREKAYQYNLPVKIGKNCWLGAGVAVLPGVTIGDGSVIGAGSVVTKDIPPFVVAYGNPCKVVREIGEKDERFYYKNKQINYDEI